METKDLYQIVGVTHKNDVIIVSLAVPTFSLWTLVKYVFTRTVTLDTWLQVSKRLESVDNSQDINK